MNTITIIITGIIIIAFLYGLIKLIRGEQVNDNLLRNMNKMDDEEFKSFMEGENSGKSTAQLKEELDDIERSFNESLDMTGLSGRAIVALKDLGVRDTVALNNITVRQLYNLPGVGVKTVEDIQAWAMGSYKIEIHDDLDIQDY
tara:strand:+ start:2593 stop:3024 length:432 start_codon:yes stop_codon:yes gene_type:complete